MQVGMSAALISELRFLVGEKKETIKSLFCNVRLNDPCGSCRSA